MTIERLMTRTVTIQSRTAGATDAYGVAGTSTSSSTTVLGYLEQALDPREVLVGQETYTADWRLVLPAATVIDQTDRVVTDVGTFEVVGIPARPWRPSTGEHHVEALLRQVVG